MRASIATASGAHQTTLRAHFSKKKKKSAEKKTNKKKRSKCLRGAIFCSITLFLVWGGLPVLIFIEFPVFWASKMPKFSRPTLGGAARAWVSGICGREHPSRDCWSTNEAQLSCSAPRFVDHAFFLGQKHETGSVAPPRAQKSRIGIPSQWGMLSFRPDQRN